MSLLRNALRQPSRYFCKQVLPKVMEGDEHFPIEVNVSTKFFCAIDLFSLVSYFVPKYSKTSLTNLRRLLWK
jgi:hypothetical protein